MRTLKTSDGKTITLNEQQNEALNLMDEWVKDPKHLFFMLAGYAGTGKTTIVKEFLNTSAKNLAVTVTAPTHKAKNVVAVATGRSGSTLQSLMGLGIDTDVKDYDPENPKFVQKRKPDFSSYQLVVVDESSMINKALLLALLQTASNFNCKVLFMGDKAQLPPVRESVSQVFSSPQITYKFQLTEVMRQADDNPLMDMYTTVRNNLSNPADLIGNKDNLSPNGEGYRFIRILDFSQEIAKRYTKPSLDPSSVKVLCWTNDEVRYWNKYIREKRMAALHPNKAIGIVFPGDILVGTATRGKLTNSEEYLVTNAVMHEIQIQTGEMFGEKVYETLPVIQVTMIGQSDKQTLVVNVLNSNVNAFVDLWRKAYFFELSKSSRTKKWHTFMEFREKVLLISPTKAGEKIIGPDVDYGYALTVHKSQGSTYDEVFIHKDINRNPETVERNQLKYVASSRPRKVAHFLV